MAFGRLISFLFFLNVSLNASVQGFKACQLKYQVSSITIEGTRAVAISEDQALFYSKETPQVSVLKRDPFLGLNLVKIPKKFRHHFAFYRNNPSSLAGLNVKEFWPVTLKSQQIGLNHLAQTSVALQNNTLISGSCCGIMGLTTPEGVIEKGYLEHFIRAPKVEYADFGIRIKETQAGVVVSEINPFYEGLVFELDDVIISMDGKKVHNAATLSRKMLFAQPGSIHRFVIKREGTTQKLSARGKKRDSGGLISDSFFNLFGLELDEFLVVKKDNPSFEIKQGDKLLYVMGKEVKTLEQIRQTLSLEKGSEHKQVLLLFRRNGFEFFIHFDKPSNSK